MGVMRKLLFASTVIVFCLSPMAVHAQEGDGPLTAEECESGQIVDGECVGEQIVIPPNTGPSQPPPTGPLTAEECIGDLVDGVCEGGPAPTTPPSDGTAPTPTGPLTAEECESGEVVNGACASVDPTTPTPQAMRLPATGQGITLATIAAALVMLGGVAIRLARR